MGRVDILTGTLGKALGGASGGFTSRQQARSSTGCASARGPTCSPTRCRRRSPARLADGARPARGRRRPARAAAATTPRTSAQAMTRPASRSAGRAPDHPGDARRRDAGAGDGASGCSSEGIYVIGFSFPVVPKGQARIRTQMSRRAHARADSTAPSPRSPRSAASWA